MISNILTLIRIKDWLKNIVIFFPIIFSNNLQSAELLISVVKVFFIFSFTSTCIYIFNDIIDIEDDKIHKIKKFQKPLAANTLSKNLAYFLLILFLIFSIILLCFNIFIISFIAAYFLINISYSLYFKRIPYFEMLIICTGYLIRLYAGSHTVNVDTSIILAMSIFSLSFFIIAIKRFVELNNQETSRVSNLDYSQNTIKIIIIFSSFVFLFCSLIFFIFFNNKLLILFPILLFIKIRYYILSLSLNIGEFPIDVVLKDKLLLLSCLALSFLTLYLYY